MHISRIAVALSLALFATGSLAIEELKPGQWDMTMDMKMKNMPKMSAEDLAAMKQMGVQIPGMGGPMKMQQCITPEQASSKFETTMVGNTSYTSKMSLKGISNGEPIDQEIETSGKWVKAKCDPGIPGAKK